ARMLPPLTIANGLPALSPETAAYILRNAPASETGLAALRAFGSDRLIQTLIQACERPDQ
ncbi:MAG TPA: hypothetical protein PKA03_16570, partial [Tabrizicola sp.]|nr:hypothetical protein [Tabrizicola sp.]